MPDPRPKVVCAPNAFKGTLTAKAAAHAMAIGVAEAGAEPIEVPVADGGDGTLEILVAGRGLLKPVTVTGPIGSSVVARLGWIGRTAIVELAEASGMRLTQRRDPMHASTLGVGQLIMTALDQGANEIIVGVGGSATLEAGIGALQELGVKVRDANGKDVPPGGEGLLSAAAIDVKNLDPRLKTTLLTVASDVSNPLYGERGAAHVFGAQKGASEQQIERLDGALQRWARFVAKINPKAIELAEAFGAGAAGGIGYSLAAICGADIVGGAQLVCDRVDIDAAMKGARLVLTGEGKFDSQTADGKAPAEVMRRAQKARLPCFALAGAVDKKAAWGSFAEVIEIGGTPGRAADCERRLVQAAKEAVARRI